VHELQLDELNPEWVEAWLKQVKKKRKQNNYAFDQESNYINSNQRNELGFGLKFNS
jgi:hypothetical protein